jgi:pyrimidine operon attenuation protein/uracil phosphoribosyltransferase
MQVLLNRQQFCDTVDQLAQQILAKYPDLKDLLFVGIQRGGVFLADALIEQLSKQHPNVRESYGQLDITFYRDDIRTNILAPDTMNLPFSIEDKIIILIDDVLFTGRTIKAALDVLLDYGRPARVELLVLADRKEHRQFPIQADYVGLTVSAPVSEKLKLLAAEGGGQNLILRGS